MSWTRFDDNWSVKMEALGLSAEDVGYLVHLIQYCSRSNKYDGRITAFKARTVTEVDDPDKILARLAEVGRIRWEGTVCVVLHLDDHLPPPSMREENRKDAERERKRRQRAHGKGDHSMCPPEACPADVPVGQSLDTETGELRPAAVPVGHDQGPGTGQDGPGQEELPPQQERDVADGIWSAPVPLPRSVRVGAVCSWCAGSAEGCPECSPEDYG